jgi:hypothetical protein
MIKPFPHIHVHILVEDPKRGFTKLYVCNYGPSGNLVGTAMYKIGFPGMTACKACVAFQTPLASWQKFLPNNFDKNKKKFR